MIGYRKYKPFGGILLLILSILACSSPAELFATATPVPSHTPTVTLTLTPTVTPTAPLDLVKCKYNDCPSSTSIDTYLGLNVTSQANVENYINIPWTDSVHFFHGWCAKDEATLNENLKKIEFYFTINDNSYLDSLQGEYYEIPDPQDSTKTEYCYGIGGVAQNWKIGQEYLIKIGLRMTDNLNDGWNDYPMGSSYPFIYRITAVETPTNTPAPTATATPRPIVYPTKAPASAGAPSVSCLVNSNIRIDNRTDGPATLYLQGPAKFTFNLVQGPNTVLVCAGSYNYTIYGTCGGASASGTGRISDGDDIYFHCN